MELSDRYILVDGGCHLTNKKFNKDLESVIKRSVESGVTKIVINGSTLVNSKEAVRLSRLYPKVVYATIGIHPHDSWNVYSEEEDLSWISELKTLLDDDEETHSIVGIGECGIDYSKQFSPPEHVQRFVFQQQVKLAFAYKKPIVVYERDAQSEILDILCPHISTTATSSSSNESFKSSILIQGGSISSLEHGMRYLQCLQSCYIGFNGSLWKDKSAEGIRKLVSKDSSFQCPLDRIIIQSDSPFMYPNSRASQLPDKIKSCLTQMSMSYLDRYCTFQRNEPCSLPIFVEMLAACLEKNSDEVALTTTFNAVKLFGLD